MRNVPWDQALDVVLQAKNLGMVRQGNMIRVAPLAELEKEREMAIARRKQELAARADRDAPHPGALRASGATSRHAPRELLSPRGSIAVDERTNVLIVRDVAGNLNQIEELVRSLDTQTPQVLVEARIVEATSRYLRDVGIQWGGDATFSAGHRQPDRPRVPDSRRRRRRRQRRQHADGRSLAVPTGPSPTRTSPSTCRPRSAPDSGGALGLTLRLDRQHRQPGRAPLRRRDRAACCASSRARASSRSTTSEARISQGTLIPFSQISAQGVQTTFQEAKLQLLVKPHVTADGSVAMHVKINRDEPDFNQTSARGDPTILKREAETDLLVMDGHTAVIGGIYTRNTGRNLDQVPFFGDIPHPRPALPAPPRQRHARRARDLPHAAHREPRRSARSLSGFGRRARAPATARRISSSRLSPPAS